MAIVGINPARYGSKRPPGTPLSKIPGGTPIDRQLSRVPIPRTRRVDRLPPAEGRRRAVVHTPEALEREHAPRAPEKGRVA